MFSYLDSVNMDLVCLLKLANVGERMLGTYITQRVANTDSTHTCTQCMIYYNNYILYKWTCWKHQDNMCAGPEEMQLACQTSAGNEVQQLQPDSVFLSEPLEQCRCSDHREQCCLGQHCSVISVPATPPLCQHTYFSLMPGQSSYHIQNNRNCNSAIQ